MSSHRSREKSGGLALRLAAITALGTLPVLVLLVDIHSAALAGCGPYGYDCTDPVCLAVEVTRDQGSSWEAGSVWLYGAPGAEIFVHVRTILRTNVSGVDGWSFGLEHDASNLVASGGEFELWSVVEGSDLATIQDGSAPDFNVTEGWDCGATQGVVIDMDPTLHTLDPQSAGSIVPVLLCYRLKFGSYEWNFQDVTLSFSDNVGSDPKVATVVTQDGQSLDPCRVDLTLHVFADSTTSPTPSYCPYSQTQVEACGGAQGGGANAHEGIPFIRGDANEIPDGDVNISDTVSILNWIFNRGPEPGCLRGADTDGTGRVNITDAIHILRYIFGAGDPPPEPFPGCGILPTASNLSCDQPWCTAGGVYTPNLSSGKVENQSETSVAINPNDRNHVVIVSMLWTATGFFRAVTTDGGVNWTTGEILTSGVGSAFADPTLAFDTFGNLFLAYGSSDPGGIFVAVSTDGGVTFPGHLRKNMGLLMDRPALATGPSSAGNQSVWIAGLESGRIIAVGAEVTGLIGDASDLCFSGEIEVTGDCSNPPDPCEPCPVGEKCQDGTCIPCDPGEDCTQPTPPCVPCGFGQDCQGGACVNLPGGQDCQRLGTRNPGSPEANATDDQDLDCFCNYADVAIGPFGEVVVAYNNGVHREVTSTRPVTVFVKLRAGAPPDLPSFAEPGFSEVLRVRSRVCALDEPGVQPFGFDFIPARPVRPFEKGVVAAPDLAWDRARNERLYVAFLDKPTLDQAGNEDHDTNVVLLFADPPYTSWQPQSNGEPAPKVVNDDFSTTPPSPVNSQFFHRIAVDQTTGHVALSWYDTRPPEGEPIDLEKVQFYATFSKDMGQTFVESFPVSDGVTDAVPIVIGNEQSTLGDYTALDFHDGIFYPVWADNSESLPAEVDWRRVNMGGGEVTAPGGVVWEADTAFLGQPAGDPVALAMTQDASKVKRPAPAAVYQAARHSADVPNAEDHAFKLEAIPAGRYDVRIHFSSPSELAPMQGDHEFNVFIQANLVTGPSPYDPSRDPALAPNFGRDKVVARAFWNRIVGASGLEIRSVPVPPQGAQAGDSFELAIELVESTHSDVHTRKVVVDD